MLPPHRAAGRGRGHGSSLEGVAWPGTTQTMLPEVATDRPVSANPLLLHGHQHVLDGHCFLSGLP